uniref:Wsv293a-like protein n=1 Tax=Melicertus latisulcatus pemonivirus TaxID=2984278 RepID=A0A9C7BI26_9VIRU|nr:MAG: wsv293a-like protein [Melicertus latisulcatus pemonivirus]
MSTDDIGEVIADHMRKQLGPGYHILAAACERDIATRSCDSILVAIIIVCILVSGGLVSYRLMVHQRTFRVSTGKPLRNVIDDQ